jgi:hypothetical protein
MPAQATANSVIASANRLIDVRQVCFKRRRIAEINVPAWPMPIHQTKFVIANPQATGTLMPQIPVPFTRRYESATSSSSVRRKAMVNPSHHENGARRANTIDAILSVTDPNV